MHYVKGALAVIALIAIILFSVQNLAAIDVTFLIWTASISKVVVIVGSYVLGTISGWGLVGLIRHSMK